MTCERELIILAAFCFGFTLKVADLIVDDNLSLFPHASLIFGALWGIFASFIVFLDDNTAYVFSALILYWLIRDKLDHLNHRIGGGILILSLLVIDMSKSLCPSIFVMLGAYEISFHIKRMLVPEGIVGKMFNIFFRFRIQFLLVPLGFSMFIGYYMPFFVISINMIAVSFAYYLFKGKIDKREENEL